MAILLQLVSLKSNGTINKSLIWSDLLHYEAEVYCNTLSALKGFYAFKHIYLTWRRRCGFRVWTHFEFLFHSEALLLYITYNIFCLVAHCVINYQYKLLLLRNSLKEVWFMQVVVVLLFHLNTKFIIFFVSSDYEY